jgi:protein CMS1
MKVGALSVDKLERIVVDVSHIDQKKRGILDMRETQVPLIEWLNRADLKERFVGEENKIDLLFY